MGGIRGKPASPRAKNIYVGNNFAAPCPGEFPKLPLMPSHNMELFERAARNFGNQSVSVPASVGVTCLDAGAREFEKPADQVIPAACVRLSVQADVANVSAIRSSRRASN